MDRERSAASPLKISIEGLLKGSRQFDLEVESSEIRGLVDEFKSTVYVEGVIHRIGRRLHVDAVARSVASLICDRSLEEYSEEISADIALEYEFDNELAGQQEGEDVDDGEVLGLFEDAKYIDIENEVRQVLALALPMKRIAPKYRDKEIEDIHPDLNEEDDVNETDSRWDALKKLKNN